MSENPVRPPSADDLQFATAELAGADPAAPVHGCAICGQPIASTYFALGESLVCPACCEGLQGPVAGTKVGRLAKAAIFGLVAGLAGAALWFAIRRIAHLEIGIVAILVGFMVGKAVRKGSGGQGGRAYQVLAVVITYCCIAANYMPDIFEAAFEQARERRAAADAPPAADAPAKPDDVAGAANADATVNRAKAPTPPIGVGEAIGAVALLLVLVFGLSLAMPFLAGLNNLTGLLIIGFALWEAWKFTAHRPLPISGPYQMGPEPVA